MFRNTYIGTVAYLREILSPLSFFSLKRAVTAQLSLHASGHEAAVAKAKLSALFL